MAAGPTRALRPGGSQICRISSNETNPSADTADIVARMSASDIRGGASVIPDIADAHPGYRTCPGLRRGKEKARPRYRPGLDQDARSRAKRSDQLQTSTRR